MKKCFVPLCQNTCVNAPNKIFIYVPKKPEIRKLWCNAVGSKKEFGYSDYYCCEDHFNLEEDAENFVKYKLVKCRLRLKKGVLPSKFIDKVNDEVDFSQALPKLPNDMEKYIKWTITKGPKKMKKGRKAAKSSKPRPSAVRVERKRLIKEILEENEEETIIIKTEEVESLFLDSTDDYLDENITEETFIPNSHLTNETNTIGHYYEGQEVLVKPPICDINFSSTESTPNFPVKIEYDCSITSSEYEISTGDFKTEEED